MSRLSPRAKKLHDSIVKLEQQLWDELSPISVTELLNAADIIGHSTLNIFDLEPPVVPEIWYWVSPQIYDARKAIQERRSDEHTRKA